jgi:cyclopropane-fatty-acyl-phospholipid synthase
MRCCGVVCCGLLVTLLAVLIGGGQYYLKQPQYAEMAVRKIVELGGIPDTVFDIVKVKDDSAWYDIITQGNLGIAEGYMHGKIDLDPLEMFFAVLNDTSVGTRRKEKVDYLGLFMEAIEAPTKLFASVFNLQTRELSSRVTKLHYDAGNDLYEVMLGPSMSYTCAYWKDATNLNDAQQAKFNLIFRKLESEPGMKVADLGMGWGTAAAYMHEHGKLDVTGVSLSEQQVKWAKDNLAKPGLKFVWSDYRDHCEDPANIGTYDRVYSIGMMEHIGPKNYEPFFKCIKALLKPDGLAVVHTIGEPDYLPVSDPFLEKYIFPGAVIPTVSAASAAFENHFILEDFQNFGHDYSKTLAAWHVNSLEFFKQKPDAYTPEFQRMWHYYLKMCEALFELRINQLWHFVLSPRPATRKRISRQL